jgi:CRP-like cAMP-binding protein
MRAANRHPARPDRKGRQAVQLDPSAFVADPELICVLEKKATLIDCASERVLFMQGDPPVGVYLLRSGSARLTMDSAEGKPIVSVTASSGSLLGLPGLLGNQPYTLTATAEAGAMVSFVPRDEFTALMHTEPLMALKMLAVLAAEVRSARRAIA